jgi:hypothetical protein
MRESGSRETSPRKYNRIYQGILYIEFNVSNPEQI